MISHPTASAVILHDGHVLLLESAKGIGFIYRAVTWTMRTLPSLRSGKSARKPDSKSS